MTRPADDLLAQAVEDLLVRAVLLETEAPASAPGDDIETPPHDPPPGFPE